MLSELELEAWQRVAGHAQSPSHDFHHIERVQAFADQIGEVLGVPTDLVRIAAILHDLGRNDESRRHGTASIEASKEIAEDILRHLHLSDEARRTIVEAIETHDQPDLSPEAEAGRILKDADFLAGFGAWGILRIAMWSGETGRRIEDVFQRMTAGMQRRLEALEFPLSRDAALREMLFARLFHEELKRPARVLPRQHEGFYFALEGISGSGKNTVATTIRNDLERRDIPHLLIEEPGKTFRKLRDVLPEGVDADPKAPLRKALLMADRAAQWNGRILPSLLRGEIVVSVRSYLSTAVYQSRDYTDAYRTLMEHDWVHPCDLLVLLDLAEDAALARIEHRTKHHGDFETLDQLSLHRTRYLELAHSFPSRCTEIIDASGDQEAVAAKVLSALNLRLESGHTGA